MWAMTFAAVLGALSATAAPTVPAQGTYLIDRDAVTVTKLEWGGRCGKVPEPKTIARGTKVELKATGETWRIYLGNRALFGTDVCTGDNRTLAVVDQSADAGGWLLRCEPKRVSRGEESVHIILRRVNMDRIEIQHRDELRYRKGLDMCNVVIERRLRVTPYVAVKDPFAERFAATGPNASTDAGPEGAAEAPGATAKVAEQATADGGSAPEAPAVVTPDELPAATFSAADVEAALAAQLERDRARRDVSDLRAVHQNTMGKDFTLVERIYKLDGKVLETSGKSGMKTGQIDRIYDDVVEAGTHVLEVEFHFRVDDGGAPVLMTMRDAAFFDTVAGETVRLKVVTYEQGGFFTSLKNRPKLRFELNDKPMKR